MNEIFNNMTESYNDFIEKANDFIKKGTKMNKEITKQDYIELLEKYDFFNCDDYCECMDMIVNDFNKNWNCKNIITCDFADCEERIEDVVDFVFETCKDRKIKNWISFYKNDFVFWLVEYEE